MGLSSGAKLGPYEIVAPLGAGGMGEVWRARDTRLDRDVAIKVLPEEFFEEKERRERFRREAKLLATVNHPNIAVVHSFEEISGRYLLVQELVEGETLAGRLAGGALSTEDVLRYGHQLADALSHAHERGVVHRDFKSANVIITPEGRAKVLDFGLAKKFSQKETDEATTLSRATLTEAGAIAGTPAYMAPEQLRGLTADSRSDVWALGVVLYEMATGRRPFQGKTGFELTSAILSQQPEPLPAAVPATLQAVIERCLAKEPTRRYQSGREVVFALEAVSGQLGAKPVAPMSAAGVFLRRHRVAVAASALLIALALGVGWWWKERSDMAGGPKRLAVLPFENLSGDPGQEYLSDGLTQEMIAQLGRLHPVSLSVIARTSVMQYKKTTKPIDQIGRELGVDYILEGSARHEAGRVRITAELIQVRDQAQLWAESFEQELAGILALQNDVAGKVAKAMALKLLPAERARIATARPVHPEAYEAYLKGFHQWHKLTPGDLEAAQRYFELAIAKDPNYALGYTGIALVWLGRSQVGLISPGEAAAKGKPAIMKALELDDTIAETHFTLAGFRTWSEWDWAGAEPEFRRAIELNPSFPDAPAYYSHLLMTLGRPDEAMPYARRALELDPFNPLIYTLYGVDLVYVHRYDEAIAQARTALQTAPDDPANHGVLWWAFSAKGMHEEAFAAAKTYWKLYDDRELDDALERGYREAGYRGAMKRAAEALIVHFHKRYANPTDIACLFLEAGEKEKALDWLEKGFEVRDQNMPYLGLPIYDSVRSEPRFIALLRKMNLPVS